MNTRKEILEKERIVIKIGSSSLTHEKTGHISLEKMERFVRQISDLKYSGKEIIIVSSGAIAVGLGALNIKTKPDKISDKQAIASIGQASLIRLYQKLFREYNITVGQVLITKDLLENENRKNNAINTFDALLRYGTIPIVNENDTVSTEEIEFGDNDTLSAIVAGLVRAELLIILSDIDGLYDSNPQENPDARLIHEVYEITPEIEGMASDTANKIGTGGMITKLQAAKAAHEHHIDMIIANADKKNVLYKIMKAEDIGTIFYATTN